MSRKSEEETREIRREILVNASPVELYGLISSAEGLVQWFCQRAVPTSEGFYVEWDTEFGPTGVVLKVIENCPPSSFVYLFGYEEEAPKVNTRVEFSITGEGEQSLVCVAETGFGEGEIADEAIQQHAHGWNYFLIRLAECLEG